MDRAILLARRCVFMAYYIEWSISLLDGYELLIHVPAAFIPGIRFIGEIVSRGREASTHSDRLRTVHFLTLPYF